MELSYWNLDSYLVFKVSFSRLNTKKLSLHHARFFIQNWILFKPVLITADVPYLVLRVLPMKLVSAFVFVKRKRIDPS